MLSARAVAFRSNLCSSLPSLLTAKYCFLRQHPPPAFVTASGLGLARSVSGPSLSHHARGPRSRKSSSATRSGLGPSGGRPGYAYAFLPASALLVPVGSGLGRVVLPPIYKWKHSSTSSSTPPQRSEQPESTNRTCQ